jgi:hypothetical protein
MKSNHIGRRYSYTFAVFFRDNLLTNRFISCLEESVSISIDLYDEDYIAKSDDVVDINDKSASKSGLSFEYNLETKSLSGN